MGYGVVSTETGVLKVWIRRLNFEESVNIIIWVVHKSRKHICCCQERLSTGDGFRPSITVFTN